MPTKARSAQLLTVCLIMWTAGCGADSPGPVPVDGGGDASDLGSGCVDLLCDNGTFCDGQERCARAGETGDARGCVSDLTGVCPATESCDEVREMCRACSFTDADGDGVTECDNDCDDVDAERYPGASEICDTDDEDCDSVTVGTRDADGDGHISSACCNGDVCGSDCDDAVPAIKPGAPELCNGIDDDCDGLIDTDDGVIARSYYPDVDGDRFGDETATPLIACAAPDGYVTLGTDCDDMRVDVYPGQTESCNGRDDDCALPIDPVSCACRVGIDPPTLCGYSSAAEPMRCSRVMGPCVAPGVFNCPASGLINGSEPEVCNDLDDDCDGRPIDEGATTPTGTSTCYTGPASTRTVGACHAGMWRCSGAAGWTCDGQVTPSGGTECGTDSNCDGNAFTGAACVPGRSDCSPGCQPGTTTCSGSCIPAPCIPNTRHWSWSGSDPLWAHGCGTGPTGSLWCASYPSGECYLTFGNYRTDMPEGDYVAHFEMASTGSSTSVYGQVLGQPGSIRMGNSTPSFITGARSTVDVPFRQPPLCRAVEFQARKAIGGDTICVWNISVDGPS